MAEPLRLVVHGHFYQPPRENPWTEEVTREASAAPFHDWNERITSECYRPNVYVWIVDHHGRLVSIVDNYEHISFDMGPTLLSWLERHHPDTCARMVAADGRRHGGMAQAFGHLILPLCNERDMRTQIRWGLADFRHRFGRPAEGMWLPEAAVNDEVLRVLADEGVRFTILAPGQAARIRSATGDWVDVSNGENHLDTTVPYRWCDGGGAAGSAKVRSVDIIFYDGAISHDLAFGLGTMSSEAFIDRVQRAAPDGGLVTIATDGETFGHHHHYGDRLLAYALAVEAPRRGIEVTNAGTFLRQTHPRHEVQVQESSWSCAHGVGRWREDCGCSTGGEPGWNQQWRAPLRAALDLLRDHAASVYERRGRRVFRDDPWDVRDAYVNVLLGAVSGAEFVRAHLVDSSDAVEAFTLLEAQRHAMAMYTSCGWFFNDVAGLETVQVLRYAARVMDLLDELGEPTMEHAFLGVLERADSNRPEEGNGRQIWRTHVEPARVDAFRVVAHLALVELLEGTPPPAQLAGHDIEVVCHERVNRGPVGLCWGQVNLTHRRTGRTWARVYAAVRLGGLEVIGANRPADPRRDDDQMAILREAFAKGANLATLIRMVTDSFGPREFGLQSALPDGAEEILHSSARDVVERFSVTMDQLFDAHRPVFDVLRSLGEPLPKELRAPAELVMARRFESAVAAQAGSNDPRGYREAVGIARIAREFGFGIDTPEALHTIERILLEAVRKAVATKAGDDIDVALRVLRLARDLDLSPNLEPAQEVVYDALVSRPAPDQGALARLGEALGLAVEHLGRP